MKGTNTITFMRMKDVPKEHMKNLSVWFGQKSRPNRTRFIVGGDKINYPGEVATPIAEMLVKKLLFNSVISTVGAKFMIIDISNFYLMMPPKCPESIRISICDIPEEIINGCNLKAKMTPNVSIYIHADRGMYVLPQRSNELLKKRLSKQGYQQSKLVLGL